MDNDKVYNIMTHEEAIKSIKANMPDKNRYPILYDALDYAIDYMIKGRSVDDTQGKMTTGQAINYWLQHDSADDNEQSAAVWCAIEALTEKHAKETNVDKAYVDYLKAHEISLEEYIHFDKKAQEFIANCFLKTK